MKFKAEMWEYIKNYRFNSLLVKNFVIILLLILLPLGAMNMYIYGDYRKSVESDIRDTSKRELGHIQEVLNGIFAEMSQMSIKLAVDNDVQVFLFANKPEYEHMDDV